MNVATPIKAEKSIGHTVCPHDCPSACALEVDLTAEGRIGRVRGSAANTYTAGVICAKVARYSERIYHPGRLMVPQRSDSLVVSAAARSYYDELLVAGVRIYEYKSRMLHSKTLVIDDNCAFIGTANFDNRSFRLNFEVAAVVYDGAFNEQLARMFDDDLSQCKLVPADRHTPPAQYVFESLARLGSPLL